MLPFANNHILQVIVDGLAEVGTDVTVSPEPSTELVTSTDFDPMEFISGKLLEMTLFDNSAPLRAFALIAVVVPETCSCHRTAPGEAPLPVFDCDVTVCGNCVRLRYENVFSDKLCAFVERVTDWRNW